jgi:WD40 repeat protein
MSSKMLYEAIALIRAAKLDEARRMIFDIIRKEPTNEMAWMWLAETLSSDQDRMKVLLACQLENPNSRITKMAIEKLQEKIDLEAKDAPTPTPFRDDETFDPNLPERTGHTGAIIGFDGSFIVSEVSDFDDVVDLRAQESAPETDEGSIVSLTEPVDTSQTARVEQAFITEDQEQVENDDYEPLANTEESQSAELEYEPDLSGLFQDEALALSDEKPFEIDESLSFEDSQDDESNHLDRLFSDADRGAGKAEADEELTAYDLGFFEDTPTLIAGGEEPTEGDTDQLKALIHEEDLVEDKVIKSGVAEFERKRKKKDRNLIILVVGLFILIAALCVVAGYVILNYTNFTRSVPDATTTQMVVAPPVEIEEPTATIAPTATEEPVPTATTTTIPTATPLVALSDRALNPDNVGSMQVKMEQDYGDLFVNTLDGSRIAFADGDIITIWNPMDGSQLFELSEHTSNVIDMAFSDNGNYLVSAADDFTVYMWNVRTGNLDKRFIFDGNAVNRMRTEIGNRYPSALKVDFSPDGSTVAAGAFGLVNIFDITTGLSRGLFEVDIEELKSIASAAIDLQPFDVRFNENGWVLIAAMNGYLVGVDSLDATPLYQFDIGANARIDFAFDRLRMLEVDLGGVLLRRMDTGEVYNGFGGAEDKADQSAPIYGLSENWEVIGIESDTEDNQIQLSIWQIALDELIIDIPAVCEDETCRNPVFSIAPKGDWIAVERFVDDNINVQLFDFTSQKEIHLLDNFADFVQSIAISPSSELIAVLDQNGVLRIWDVAFGAQRASRDAEGIEKIEFSKDGRFLFGWNSETLKVWSLP